MIKESWNKVKRTLVVPLGIVAVLIPFSLLIGWNSISLLLFWFVLVPTLSIHLPKLISKASNYLVESLTGLTIFYAIMVFMIYDHYKTDYFQIMMISFVINSILVSVVVLTRRQKTQVQ